MLLRFRHGIVSGSNFIQTGPSGLGIFATPSEPIVFTIAHKDQNILHTVNTSLSGAFNLSAPFSSTHWLFVEVEDSGKISFGHTNVEPVVSDTQPTTLVDNLHWYDTVNYLHKVWRADFNRFDVKKRVFLATVSASGTLSYYGAGVSQISVSLPYRGFISGRVVYDVPGKALHQSNGELFLSTTDVYIGGALTGGITLEKGTILAKATENMSANTIVKLVGDPQEVPEMSIATYADTQNSIIGYVSTPVSIGETTIVSLQGVIVNDSWDWTSDGAVVGSKVWIGTGAEKGTPTITDPADVTPSLLQQPAVGRIIDNKSVYFSQAFDLAEVGTSGGASIPGAEAGYETTILDSNTVISTDDQWNKSYFVDTTNGPVTITFDYTDVTLEVGKQWIKFMDYAGTFGSNNLIIDPSPALVYETVDTLVWNVNNSMIEITYTGPSRGFVVTETA